MQMSRVEDGAVQSGATTCSVAARPGARERKMHSPPQSVRDNAQHAAAAEGVDDTSRRSSSHTSSADEGARSSLEERGLKAAEMARREYASQEEIASAADDASSTACFRKGAPGQGCWPPGRRKHSPQRRAKPPKARSGWMAARFNVGYVLGDTRIRLLDALLNVLVVLLVVTFVAVVDVVIGYVPALFVRFAEKEAGESDILLAFSPAKYDVLMNTRTTMSADVKVRGTGEDGGGGALLMNYLRLEEALAAESSLKTAPRWLARGVVRDASGKADLNVSVNLLVYDDSRESSARIGRSWQPRALGKLEAHASQSILESLGVRENTGERVLLQVNLRDLLQVAGFDDARNLLAAVLDVLDITPGANISIPIPGGDLLLPALILTGSAVGAFGAVNGVSSIPLSDFVDTPEFLAFFGAEPILTPSFSSPLAPAAFSLRQEGQDLSSNISDVIAPELPVQDELTVIQSDLSLSEAAQLLLQNSSISLANQTLDIPISSLELFFVALWSELDWSLSTEVTIVDQVTEPGGKWPSRLGNVLALEARNVIEAVVDMANKWLLKSVQAEPQATGFGAKNTQTQLSAIANLIFAQAINRALVDFLKSLNVFALVPLVGVQDRERLAAYLGGEDALTRRFALQTNRISELLGVDFPVDVFAPVMEVVGGGLILLDYLGAIFLIILILIAFLGGVLIFSLAQSEMAERTYEFGMLRALGLRFHDLLAIMVLRGLRSALIGFAIGLALACVALIIVNAVFSDITSFALSVALPVSTVIFAVLVGLFVPLAANILPARRALGKSLKDALDVSKNASDNGPTVKFRRLENIGINWWLFVTGAFLLISGVVFYYVLPSSFIDEDFRTFFIVINLSLILMLLGLSFISQLGQVWIQRALLWILIPPFKLARTHDDRKLRPLVARQLKAHLGRNKNAALMVTVGVAFIIFGGATIQQQVSNVRNSTYESYGSDVFVRVLDDFTDSQGLSLANVHTFLEREKAEGYVASFSFLRGPLSVKLVSSPSESLAVKDMKIYGIDNELFDTIREDLSVLSKRAELDPSSGRTVGFTNTEEVLLNPSAGVVSAHYGSRGAYPTLESLYSMTSAVDYPLRLRFPDTVLRNQTLAYSESTYYEPVHLVLSAAGNSLLSFDPNMPIKLGIRTSENSFDFAARPVVMYSTLAGFAYSSYESTFRSSELLAREADFLNLYRLAYNISSDGEKNEMAGGPVLSNGTGKATLLDDGLDNFERIFISIRGDQDIVKASRRVANGLRAIIPENTDIVNVHEALESSQSVADGLIILLTVISAMSVILCFISLWFTFQSNGKEDQMMFAVLRSMGMTVPELRRLFILESLAVVLYALIMGTLSGVVVSVTLALQDMVVNESRFKMFFPVISYAVMLSLDLLAAVLAPVLIVRGLTKRPVAGILRSV
ncbi:hypothetical protein FVE85_5576 [Porphyridium purpureum]|uniref:ABC3 transporter permease C-terminal domain-containing protein n=1 Tax=Porphyridium purpureum TaxID=35688 RepID=A0A5J4Z2C7_PORPP|nr:hypothetical protein FVE85_5576 [Porphyridium purpureum]|eukprot:POR6780..scf295_1